MSPEKFALNPTELIIYRVYQKDRGQVAADNWLKEYLVKSGRLTCDNVSDKSTIQISGTEQQKNHVKALDWQKAELANLLQRARNRDIYGSEATTLAEGLIGESWRTALGVAYPLVLLLVKGALEAGHRPGEEDANRNRYHCFSTHTSLGVLCAAVAGREKSYSDKTIQRWLSPKAPHAKALRCWLGWRHWTTDTLLEYRRGVNPKTGEAYRTGESKGPVIGGTLYRVRLEPFEEVTQEQLEACCEDRPSVLQPLKPELQHPWRDLELDRHQGKTRLSSRSVPLEEVDVRINEGRTKDRCQEGPVLYLDRGKTHDPPLENVLHQSYLYPDIATLAGAAKLRGDVETTALWLMRCIEGPVGEERKRELLNRYRHAVWTAYKTHRYGDTREGYELLLLAKRLAFEVRRTQHTIRDVGAYVWSVIEKRGFAELRRDYSYRKGRYLRVFSLATSRHLGLTL